MSQGFNLDNQGSGFALDDDEDLEALLDAAGAAEGSDDEDTAAFFTPGGAPSSPVSYEEPVAPTVPVYEEPAAPTEDAFYSRDEIIDTPAPQQDFNEFNSLLDEPAHAEVVPEPVYEPAPAPEIVSAPEPEVVPSPAPQQGRRSWERDPNPSFVAPTPAVEEPVQIATPEPARQSKFSDLSVKPKPRQVPDATSEDFLRVAIQVLDVYRKLDKSTKDVVSQFVSNGEKVYDSEAEFILAAFAVDPILAKTMRSLKESKDLDPVERAFYIVSLDDDILYNLGDLVSVFTKGEMPSGTGRIGFARQLVKEIEQLDTRSLTYVEATEAVLAATNTDEKE